MKKIGKLARRTHQWYLLMIPVTVAVRLVHLAQATHRQAPRVHSSEALRTDSRFEQLGTELRYASLSIGRHVVDLRCRLMPTGRQRLDDDARAAEMPFAQRCCELREVCRVEPMSAAGEDDERVVGHGATRRSGCAYCFS